MKVGILSDTHGVLPAVAFAEMADCDHIIHAGDICDPGILTELETLAPVTAVLGNNDYPEYGSMVTDEADITLEGVRMVIAHTPQQIRGLMMRACATPGTPSIGVAIHGHTHVPEKLLGSAAAPAHMMLCPGSVSRPRGGSAPTVIKLDVSGGLVRGVTFVELSN